MKQDNLTALGNTLHRGMQDVVTGNRSVIMELGIINADMSLTTDSYPQPLPCGSYMVSLHLTSDPGLVIERSDGHTHDISTRTLRSGDRVLVARVGTERIVTAIVTNSNNI